jgi:ABC-type sugar transport system substrate-binding protein
MMTRTNATVLKVLTLLTLLTHEACDHKPFEGSGAPSSEGRAVIISYSAPQLVGGQLNIHQSLEKHAKGKGWQVITTTSDGDPAKQVAQIKNFIKLRADAIVAVPDDSRGICAAVEAARAAKIPFYTIDRAPEGCAVNMVVLSDNHLAGRQSAETMVSLLEGRYKEPKGTILEITGDMAQNVAELRGQGFHEVLAARPGIKLITREAGWSPEKGELVLREALAATPELDGVYLHSDAVYLPGTLKVLRETGRLKRRGEPGHVFLSAVDGSRDGVQAIKDGTMDQASSQPVPDFGIVVDWIEQELKGRPVTEGEVKREGALWSPARVTMRAMGPTLMLPTTSVTEVNVGDKRLWANQP